MTRVDRHRDLERLRARWTASVLDVRVAKPGTPAWTEARLTERHHAAAYMDLLTEPEHPDEAAGEVDP